jgi:hypothetical protein
MAVDPAQIFPLVPFDGQEFIDSYRIKWKYNSEDDVWSRVGYISDLPLARGTDDPVGPTNGLLSAIHKRILDITPNQAGGCGFVFEPGTYLEDGVDSILIGDINIKSSTLDLSCGNGFCADTLKFSIKPCYLDKLCIETVGATGATGDDGATGSQGLDGVGDGPQGAAGADGKNATTPAAFTGITIKELSGIYDTAVVDLILDNSTATLEVTKAKIAVPDHDEPASKVSATPTPVGIAQGTYDPTVHDNTVVLTGYTLNDTDIDVVKLPDGWSGEMEGPVAVATMPITSLINAIARYYETKADDIIDAWDDEIAEYIKQKDAEARNILSNKANQLSEEVWQAPIEFCLLPSADVIPPC